MLSDKSQLGYASGQQGTESDPEVTYHFAGPLFSQADSSAEFFHSLVVSVSKPAIANHLGKWCVARETIPTGKLGGVAASGIVSVSLQLDLAGSRDSRVNVFGKVPAPAQIAVYSAADS
jgi:hypothetical protein